MAQSFREWEWSQRTAEDERRQKLAIQKELLNSFHVLWQKWANAPRDDKEAAWLAEFERVRVPLVGWDLDAYRLERWAGLKKKPKAAAEYWQYIQSAGPEESPAEVFSRVRLWLKENRAKGSNAKALLWERRWLRLRNCQSEWIGFRAGCCGDESPMVAVPVGCNGRMCPLCAAHRSQRARVQIKTLFDRLTHPVMITLTVPNLAAIRKHDFTVFRQRVRKFIAQHKAWIKGGVYSLETTYNRTEKSWHIHTHILCDVVSALPTKNEWTVLAHEKERAFTAIKLKLEFDWARLWVSGRLGRMAAQNASAMVKDGDVFDFCEWVRGCRSNKVKVWSSTGWRIPAGLSAAELVARTRWNTDNRRVIDIRPVIDREGAAFEVLKYITKSADFSDLPEAVEAFYSAVEGARLVQTFGSWYGVNFDAEFDPNHLDDWGQMRCACGINAFERVGVFYRSDVVFDSDGKTYVRPDRARNVRGTVPRPTIRALEYHAEPEELCLHNHRMEKRL